MREEVTAWGKGGDNEATKGAIFVQCNRSYKTD
jgi:hypothetical protein